MTAPDELTFVCDSAVVKLELLDTNVAHVCLTANGVPFSTNASFTVIRDWPRPPMTVIDGDTMLVSNAVVYAEIQNTPFRMSFGRPDGTILLTDTNTTGLTYAASGASAAFQMPAAEQYYGLGLTSAGFSKPI